MKRKQPSKVIDQLRAAVEASPMTRYRIGKLTGLDKGLLSRFVHGESGLSCESIDTLCELLGLELQPVKTKESKPKRRASKAVKKPTKKQAKRPARKATKKKGRA